ncbi:MAG: DNA gyrase subunit A [Alphaproteobacteria bacterium]|nr:DNA gyrase subunit A [Alphaproteobacteria bacterium]
MTTLPPTQPKDISTITIEEEMKRSYLDYAMSVIVSRALPDVRDGLKPVHRRILYAMKEAGFDYNRPFRKSARVTGEVMGKFHPHGNIPVYDAMVRMAQSFSMRLPLIEGHGNFGSMDGDPPAADRYTEARLARSAHTLLEDIDKETVDFQPNYDNTTVEPKVLPASFPNILVNGAGGIAVGMATNIPPHNLGEVIDACCAYIDNPDITLEELMELVPGPDFPTGAQILGRTGIWGTYSVGRGSIMMRSKTHIEEVRKDREAIIVTETPYQVNKSRLVERIAEVVNLKIVEGISDLRDESDRDGVRVVIELKRDAQSDVVLNQLFRHTPLQTSFGANIVVLNQGRPVIMPLKDIIQAFIHFREEVITRRIRFELKKARERAHLLVGLAIAVANIDEMIDLIRKAADPTEAREEMMARHWPAASVEPLLKLAEPGRDLSNGTYQLSEIQAKAILDLRLHRLTGLERDKIGQDLKEIIDKIIEYLGILGSKPQLMAIMRAELLDIREKFATPRRTEILEGDFNTDVEDLIPQEDMVITVSHSGYIKRVPLVTYRAQKRGGRGRSGMATRDEDFVRELFVANTHTPIIFFSSLGKAYVLKVYKLPLGTPQSRGKAMINLLPLAEGENISTVMPLPEDQASWDKLHIMFATSHGTVRRNALSDFTNIMANGKIAMKLGEGEKLIAVKTCSAEQDVLLTTKYGRCIRFSVNDVRKFTGRTSTGVRGIRLAAKDEVISMTILDLVRVSIEERDAYLKQASRLRRAQGEIIESDEDTTESTTLMLSDKRFQELAAQEEFILSVTSKGFGKRTSAFEYRATKRGGQGFANMELTAKNGTVVSTFPVKTQDHIMLVTDGGQLIRCPVHDIRIAGRRTQGVTLFRISADENVVSVARIDEDSNAEIPESEVGQESILDSENEEVET